MRVDFTCPAELRNIETKNGVCTFYVKPLESIEIRSVSVLLSLYNSEKELINTQQETYNLDNTKQPLSLSINAGADFVDLEITNIVDTLGNTWNAGRYNEFEYELPKLSGEELYNLQLVSGSDAICYPNIQGDIWQCVCGRPNRSDEKVCKRCGRLKEDIFINYTKENIDKAVLELKEKTKEENKKEREAAESIKKRQKEVQHKKDKKTAIYLICTSIAIVLIFIVFLLYKFALPKYNNFRANKYIEYGEYDKAVSILNSLPKNYNIDNRLKKINYEKSILALENDDIESIESAIVSFESLGDYKDSKDYIVKAKLILAQKYYDKKEYKKTLDYLDGIDSKEAKDIKTKSSYNLAVDSFKNEDIDTAYELFKKVENYEDSSEYIKNIEYIKAQKLLENGEYALAIEKLEPIKDYSGAEYLLLEAKYNLANKLFNNNELKEAGDLYLYVASNNKDKSKFEDANLKANISIYQVATLAYDNANYDEALKEFAKIKDYLNSNEKYINSAIALCNKAIDELDFDKAQDIISSIPENKETIKIARDIRYKKAMKLYDEESYEEAYKAFEEFEDETTNSIKKDIEYKIAESYLENSKFDEAIAAFDNLKNYSDSQMRKNESIYKKAMNLAENNNVEEAIKILQSISNYSDSNTQAKNLCITYADEYIKNDEYEKAEKLLELIVDDDDIQEKLSNVRYTLATIYINKNEYKNAYEVLDKLGDYRDSEELKSQMQYKYAQELEGSGNIVEAAWMYYNLNGESDSKVHAERMFNMIYETHAQKARDAYAKKDYNTAFEELKSLELGRLPDMYEDLYNIYRESCYNIANEYLESKNAFKALKYYRLIPDYEDVGEILKDSNYYMIGSWTSEEGDKLEFSEDGSAIINGVKYNLYFVENFRLYLGENEASLQKHYNLSDKAPNSIVLKELMTNNRRTIEIHRVLENNNGIEIAGNDTKDGEQKTDN